MYKQKAQGLKLLVAEVEKQIAQTWFLLVPGDWHSILAEFSHLVPSLTVWQLQIHRNPDQDKAITEDYDYILFFCYSTVLCLYGAPSTHVDLQLVRASHIVILCLNPQIILLLQPAMAAALFYQIRLVVNRLESSITLSLSHFYKR